MNQYIAVVFIFKKKILIVISSNIMETFLVSVAMSGHFFRMCIVLVEEVLTCAHAPQHYQEIS